MVGGFVFSLIVFAVGAVLDFALTVAPDQHGVNVQTVGLILMIVGAIGAVLTLLALLTGGRRRRVVVRDAGGTVVQREEESYL